MITRGPLSLKQCNWGLWHSCGGAAGGSISWHILAAADRGSLSPEPAPSPGVPRGPRASLAPSWTGRAESPLKGSTSRTHSLGRVVLMVATDTNHSPRLFCVSIGGGNEVICVILCLSVPPFIYPPSCPSRCLSVCPSIHPMTLPNHPSVHAPHTHHLPIGPSHAVTHRSPSPSQAGSPAFRSTCLLRGGASSALPDAAVLRLRGTPRRSPARCPTSALSRPSSQRKWLMAAGTKHA